ncbi:MAG: hypothetical protein IPN20_08220 [Haliscomenobacter sp.]|nr:hypothetical protein [Haliscomenobacter sp.]
MNLGVFSELPNGGKTSPNSLKDQWGYIYGHWTMLLLTGIHRSPGSAFPVTLLHVGRYYGLEFVQSGQGFWLSAGLFTRHEQSISLPKVQMVKWSANPCSESWVTMKRKSTRAEGLLAAAAASSRPGVQSASDFGGAGGVFSATEFRALGPHPHQLLVCPAEVPLPGAGPWSNPGCCRPAPGKRQPPDLCRDLGPADVLLAAPIAAILVRSGKSHGAPVVVRLFTRYFRQSPWEKIQA